MKLSLHRILVAASLVASVAPGCTGLMIPPGGVMPGRPVGAPAAAPPPALAADEHAGARSNNCVTATRCNWKTDCPDGGHCNSAMGVCFDPDPVASSLLTCQMNECRWDTDCPSGWSCNSATWRCQLR